MADIYLWLIYLLACYFAGFFIAKSFTQSTHLAIPKRIALFILLWLLMPIILPVGGILCFFAWIGGA